MHRSRPALVTAIVVLVAAALAACSGDGLATPAAPTRTNATAPPAGITVAGAPTARSTSTAPATSSDGPPPSGASHFVQLASARLVDTGPSEQCAGSHQASEALRVLAPDLPSGTTAVVVNVLVREVAGAGDIRVASGVAGAGDITVTSGAPAAGAVSATSTTAPGAGRTWQPVASVAGRCDAVAKLAVVTVGADGAFTLMSTTAARLSVDLVGAFVSSPAGARGGRLVTNPPTRVLDTSLSLGAPGPVPAGGQIEVQVGGAAGVPVTGASAVVLQVAITDAGPPGAVRLWPNGSLEPAADALLVPAAGWAATNLVIVALSGQGKLTIRTTAKANLALDVVGWFTDDNAPNVTNGLVVPGASRLLDTRIPQGAGALAPGYRRDQPLTPGVPALGVAAALVVATAIGPSDAGALTLYPAGTPKPYDPSMPVQGAGLTSTSPLLVQVGDGSRLSVTTGLHTDLTLDVAGYVLGTPAPADPLVPPIPPDQTGTPQDTTQMDATIQGFLSSRGLAGASVTVAKDGRVVYARAFGTMDKASGEPVRVDTRFRFASISKVITAAAVLELVQAGALGLDDSVVARLAGRIAVTDNPDPRIGQVTIRELLRHTSGFTKNPDPFFAEQPGVVAAFGPGGPKSCEEAARWFLNTKALVSNPGSEFQYVNMNYCLLSLLVEQATHEQYDKIVQSLVLERRNVRDARIGNSFNRRADEVAYPAANGTFLESLSGAGGWLGTSVDLVRFVDGLDPAKPGNHLLNQAMYDQMIQSGPGSWGLGVEVFDPGTWGHTGSLTDARSMTVHQADGTTWAMVVNGTFDNHTGALRDLMRRALAVAPAWPAYDYSPELP